MVTDLEILPGWLATPHRFVFHVPSRTAVLADLHLGFERELNQAGTLMPDFTTGPLEAAWAKVLARRPARIVMAGDLFHSCKPDPATWDFAGALLAQARCKVTITPGNHDPAADVLQEAFGSAQIVPAAVTPDWAVAHGHDLAAVREATGGGPLVVGHQHPAVRLVSRAESAKMICYAVVAAGPGGRPVVLLPPFSRAPLGSNLLNRQYWILDMAAPEPGQVRIAGLVKGRVLDFGLLSGLPTL